MLHRNKDAFVRTLERAAKNKGFPLSLMEKDYYLTLILSKAHELSKELVFKGGTCLNKVYYAYYRLSEDLDFSMKLPQYEATRGERRKCFQPIKEKIAKFAEQFDMKIIDSGNPGRNESRQYVYYLSYPSVVRPIAGQIKFEVGLRFNPIHPPEARNILHAYTHPFTGEPLLNAGNIICLSLPEVVSEKLRAAALRETIAPRDFYDVDFILRHDFDIASREVVTLFKKKIAEDGADPDLKKYSVNMGRSVTEIKAMKGRIEAELFDVLTVEERKHFNLDVALKRVNEAMGHMK